MPPRKRKRMFKPTPPRKLIAIPKVTLQAPNHIPFYLEEANQSDRLFRYMTPIHLSGANILIKVTTIEEGITPELELVRTDATVISTQELVVGTNAFTLGEAVPQFECFEGVLKQGTIFQVWITLTVNAYADTED